MIHGHEASTCAMMLMLTDDANNATLQAIRCNIQPFDCNSIYANVVQQKKETAQLSLHLVLPLVVSVSFLSFLFVTSETLLRHVCSVRSSP